MSVQQKPFVERNIEINQGQPLQLSFPVRDSNGNPVDVTGAGITFKIRRYVNTPAIFTATEADLATPDSSDPTAVQINVPTTYTAGWRFGSAKYEITVNLPDGPLVVARGYLRVTRNLTAEVTGDPTEPVSTGGGTVNFIVEWSGHGPPGTILGSEPGDSYLDVDTGDVYVLS